MQRAERIRNCGKVIVVGDGACGKTCLLEVFKKNRFPEDYIPTVVDNFVKDVTIDGEQVALTLWDTAGQEEYDSVRPLAYRDSDLVLLCYTIENRDGLENLIKKWLPEVKNYSPDAGCFLVGLKCDVREDPDNPRYDRNKITTFDEGERAKEQLGAIAYVECSAKNDYNVKELFDLAGRYLIDKKDNSPGGGKRWFFCYCC